MAPDTWDPAACQGSIEGWRLEPIHLHFRWQDTDLNPNAEPLLVGGWCVGQLRFRARFTRRGESRRRRRRRSTSTARTLSQIKATWEMVLPHKLIKLGEKADQNPALFLGHLFFLSFFLSLLLFSPSLHQGIAVKRIKRSLIPPNYQTQLQAFVGDRRGGVPLKWQLFEIQIFAAESRWEPTSERSHQLFTIGTSVRWTKSAGSNQRRF